MKRRTAILIRLALAVSAGALWAALQGGLILIPQPAHAQEAQDILRQRIRQHNFVQLYVDTRSCMLAAGIAMLRHNEARGIPVQHFMVTECGDRLVRFLQADGMGETEARNTLVHMARTTYYEDVLHIPEPPGKMIPGDEQR